MLNDCGGYRRQPYATCTSIVNIFDVEDKGHRDDLEDLRARHRPLVREQADMF